MNFKKVVKFVKSQFGKYHQEIGKIFFLTSNPCSRKATRKFTMISTKKTTSLAKSIVPNTCLLKVYTQRIDGWTIEQLNVP